MSTTNKDTLMSHISCDNCWNSLSVSPTEAQDVGVYRKKGYSLSSRPPSSLRQKCPYKASPTSMYGQNFQYLIYDGPITIGEFKRHLKFPTWRQILERGEFELLKTPKDKNHLPKKRHRVSSNLIVRKITTSFH